jgi:CDP-diacylglycerol--glycerol-3-phosphate 3-phosphatidyltransferase
LFDGRWRKGVERGIEPVGVALRRTGLRADHLTATGVVMAGATAVAIGSGRLFLGLVLLGASALPDLLDGAVAKASGSASDRGAFFDSVADRVTDSLVLGGIAWHLAATDGGTAALLPFAVLATSFLISYERAKAESLGFDARGGLMERAERIIAICIALAFPVLLVPILWTLLALTSFTAGQRFVKVWRQASAPRTAQPVEPSRWRSWRESAALRVAKVDGPGERWRRRRRETSRRTGERGWRAAHRRTRVRP